MLGLFGYLPGMWILAAVVVFVVAFVLNLLSVSTGNVSLLFLGLALMAIHLMVGSGLPWRRVQ